VAGTATDLAAPLKQMAEVMKKRGMVILLSDLLTSIETLEKDLSGLSACGHEILVFLVLDPAEMRFEFSQAGIYQDAESGRDLYLDPVLARKGYLKRLEHHLAAAKNICHGLGIEFHSLSTDRPLELALFDFLRSRTRAHKKLRRARAEVRSSRP